MSPRADLKRPRSLSNSLIDVPVHVSRVSPSAEYVELAMRKSTVLESPTHKSKKLKLLDSYNTESPFPNFIHPTPQEAKEVHDILSNQLHPNHPIRIRKVPIASTSNNSATTCGSVPNVIESLIGTILSQNTSSRNSSAAKKSLDTAFGRNAFDAIADAPRQDVVEAIRCGGLANRKAATIQNVLRSVKEKHGAYSLQHLAAFNIEDAMKELVSYDGVGPKTASCVLMFCLGKESFAVDTHVYRLSKLLGWVPRNGKVDRVLAQAHLDLRLPGELKYGLHVLMIQHGKICKGCKGTGKDGACVLKTYLKEKGGASHSAS